MRIAEVYVDGFKNIVDTRIKLNDVTCIISPNNFGKSNLLKAIMNGFAFIRSTSNDNRCFFSQKENMPLLKTMQEKPYSFEIVLNDETKTISYGFSYNWDTGGHGYGMVTEEHLKVKESGARKPRTYLLRKHPMRCRYLISSHSSSMDELDVPTDQLAFAWLARTKKVFFSGILEAIDPDRMTCSVRGTFFTMEGVPLHYVLGRYDKNAPGIHYGFQCVEPLFGEHPALADHYLREVEAQYNALRSGEQEAAPSMEL